MKIAKQELIPFKNEFFDTLDFFEDVLILFIDKDFEIKGSIQDLQDCIGLHTNPIKFNNLMKILNDNIENKERENLELRSRISERKKEREKPL